MLKNYPYRDQDTGGGGGILPSDESLRNRLKEIQLAEDNLRLELETNKVYESRNDLKKQISSISGQIQDLLVEEAFYEDISEATLRSKTELLQSQEKAQKALFELEIVKLSTTGDTLDILEMEEEMLKGTLGGLDAQKNKEFDDAVAGGELEDLREGVKIREREKRQTGLDLKAEIAGVGFETSVNVATDALTTALGWAPPLYAVANFLSAGGANLVSQKVIRGKEDIDWGEAWASAGLGTIPFMSPAAGRLTKVVGNPNSI